MQDNATEILHKHQLGAMKMFSFDHILLAEGAPYYGNLTVEYSNPYVATNEGRLHVRLKDLDACVEAAGMDLIEN